MKFGAIVTSLLLPASAFAAFTKDDYSSGRVHQKLVDMKERAFAKYGAMGAYDSRKWKSWKGWRKGNWRQRDDRVKCRDGYAVVEPGNANQTFRCKNMDLYDFVSHADLGSWAGRGCDTWGWVSDDGREFVAVGQADGTAFAEITKRGKLSYLGRLPQTTQISSWCDMKGIGGHYMIIGSEAVGAGVQVFDLNKLLTLDPANPVNFSVQNDLTGFYDDLPRGRSHNLVVNEELQYGVAVGAMPRNDSCAAGLIYLDLSDPSNPTSPGCAGQDGYVHDAQCVVYRGPHTKYQGQDICYGFNEDTLTIYASGDKQGINSSTVISRTPYVGASYSHQGWVLDLENQEWLLLDDELDEREGAGPAASGRPVTYIFDIRNLEAPINTGHYFSSDVPSIDHNLYVIDGLAYHSNYGSGFRVNDVSSIPRDPTGNSVEEVAFFDIYPEDDSTERGGATEFVGTWGNVPSFPSGFSFINTIERGGFVVKMTKPRKGQWWNRGAKGKHW